MTRNVVVDRLARVPPGARAGLYLQAPVHELSRIDRDEFVGMVSLSDVRAVSRELWAFKQVRDVHDAGDRLQTLHPSDDATEALSRMVSADVGRMPVLDDGRLVGIVSRRDIMNLFKIKSESGLT